MTTAYTNLLGLALPVDGELTGAWGSTINNSITSLIEDAVANFATHDITAGNWTLTTTGSGTSNEARMAMLVVTGTPGTTRSIVAPGHSKMYLLSNQSNASITVKSASTTGVTVAAGQNTIVAWNNVDFVEIKSTQVLNLAGGAASQIPYQSAAGTTTFIANGTTGQVLTSNGTSAPSWQTPTTVAVNTGTSSNITGLLKGNGSTISEATANTDYLTNTSSYFGTGGSATYSGMFIQDVTTYTFITPKGSGMGLVFGNAPGGLQLTPAINNSNICGTSSTGWASVSSYAFNTLSDQRAKEEQPYQLGLAFIKEIRPKAYKMKVGGYDSSEITEDTPCEDYATIAKPIAGHRVHYGFYAQQIKNVIDSMGVADFGGWVIEDINDPESTQSLRYDQFISPIVKAIQEQQDMIESLQARLVALGG